MKIGLLGFGVVGRGVYDLTADRDDIQVAKVVCLEDVSLPDAEVTRDFQSVLNAVVITDDLNVFAFIRQHACQRNQFDVL